MNMENITSKQKFTTRQKQILSLVRKGLTNVEICKALNISANTVKVHLAKIYKIMDVSNRTEAASLGLSDECNTINLVPEIKLLMVRKENFDNPQMNMLMFLLTQNLHRYHLFQIQSASRESRDGSCTYQIILTGTQEPKPSLYLSLYNGNMTQIIWVYSQKVDERSDIEFLSNQIVMHLYRQMLVAAAQSFEKHERNEPSWWFVSAYVNYKLNCRNRESWEKCECDLLALLQKGITNVFLKFTLVRLYYMAITEAWIKAQDYIGKIQELACSSMRNEPYSQYSRLMMALFNILSGNEKDAIAYLLSVTEANPENVWATMLLSQMYLLMGEESKALELIKEYERYFPDLGNDPNQIIPTSFIYFLSKNYDECEKYAMRAAYIRQETFYPLLFVIVCRSLKGDWKSVETYKKLLFEYHPDFKIANCTRLLNGVHPERRQEIEMMIEQAFEKKS